VPEIVAAVTANNAFAKELLARKAGYAMRLKLPFNFRTNRCSKTGAGNAPEIHGIILIRRAGMVAGDARNE